MDEAYRFISRRKNGDRLIGIAGPLGEDLYAAGTPPVWGLATRPAPSSRLGAVRIGDRLHVAREGDRWVVRDIHGILGNLRWLPGNDGKIAADTGALLRLPVSGILHVQRLVIDPNGLVKDVGGYVEPN
ncbi:hypothetical protein AB0383_00295 [Amycolatopsis sp. NPDC051373]|uniref:hypothetical protein n=1 Tax=Amycolatopsis sp. NPDC051373 TaxID=3155801 RepID=UPI00344EAF8F